MKRRLITVMLFALVSAAASSTVLYKIIAAGARQPSRPATSKVLVASRDLTAGALLGDADVAEVEWPAITGAPWLWRRQDVVGRGLLSAINRNEPFAESRLAAKGAGAGMASSIPPGMRVIAVHVDEQSGLSRFILPGMHVDVISTGNAAGPGGAGMSARTILQNVTVFTAGGDIERDAKEKPAAVPAFHLLVTPQQAEVLSQAVAQTRIELVLRNPLDKSSFLSALPPAQLVAADARIPKVIRTVLNTPVPPKIVLPAAPPPQEIAPVVEVIHGSKRTFATVGDAAGQDSKK